MSKYKAATIASVLAIALLAAPISSAFANGRHHGAYGSYGVYYGGALALGLASAVVGTAAALITAPIALLAAAAQAPVYYGGPAPAYPVAPTAYYGAPIAPAYYAPRVAPAYSGPPAASVYYNAPVAPVYYGPPITAAYYAPRPAYYAPRPTYYGPPVRYYAVPRPRYYYGR